ncbi:hypothetical protein RAC89_11190 [Paenibacillus sp. GD4]|uniref:hypothetical protein n=1 Tax=Paenibacillus TaxID=44249 RepID=UPI00254374FC|nr:MULTISPECIES: hypothetical protein [Paenibacillus]MDQ1911015.1 hypothetical protein [Paenibacillus sp. GD4]
MGIKFGREYNDIITDFTEALMGIEEPYSIFEMTPEEWADLNSEEQQECVKTLADDLFYGLGTDPRMNVGNCTISHDKKRHLILVNQGETLVRVIHLV